MQLRHVDRLKTSDRQRRISFFPLCLLCVSSIHRLLSWQGSRENSASIKERSLRARVSITITEWSPVDQPRRDKSFGWEFNRHLASIDGIFVHSIVIILSGPNLSPMTLAESRETDASLHEYA